MRNMKYLLVVAAIFFYNVTFAQALTTSNVTSPVISATHAQMTSGTLAGSQLDAPLATYTVSGTRYWLATSWVYSGGLSYSFLKGNLDEPYSAVAWTKDTCHRNSGNYCVNGPYTAFTNIIPTDVVDLWFMGVYQTDATGANLLAFVHEEQVGNSGGSSSNHEGFTRIGLAWSSDYGNNWTYLGRIISPYGDPQPFNIQGAPYVIKDGYFYVYFTDSVTGAPSPPNNCTTGYPCIATAGIGIARASVADVIAAAQSGGLGNNLWQKYFNGSFSQPALGGQSSPIAPWGITHTQAVHSSYTGKYYLALSSMAWSGSDTFVKLYESTDAINWTSSPSFVVADEPAARQHPDGGYQYCTLADPNGGLNGEVGQYIYVYCEKDPLGEGSNFALYRWEVNLGPSIDSYRQSTDFSSSQGPIWFYQYGDGGVISTMSWLNPYWSGTDSWARIYPDVMHPGTSQVPVLKWVAPKAGTVFIGGTVRKADPTCGDGISASLVHNGTQIFSANIAYNDTVGQSPNLYQTVAAGDGLFFMISSNSNNYCDMTAWDPSVTYQ